MPCKTMQGDLPKSQLKCRLHLSFGSPARAREPFCRGDISLQVVAAVIGAEPGSVTRPRNGKLTIASCMDIINLFNVVI